MDVKFSKVKAENAGMHLLCRLNSDSNKICRVPLQLVLQNLTFIKKQKHHAPTPIKKTPHFQIYQTTIILFRNDEPTSCM